MKPSPDYIKKLLVAFQDSPDPTTDINELKRRGLSYETSEFYFHLRLLNDDGFVEREDGRSGLGVDISLDGNYQWSDIPLRLTSAGYTFAEAMNNNKAFEEVKKSAISSSISFMRDIAVSALKVELAKHGVGLGH